MSERAGSSPEEQADDPMLLTAAEAALYLKVSLPTFNRKVREGLISPVPTILRRNRKYRKSDLDNLTGELNSRGAVNAS